VTEISFAKVAYTDYLQWSADDKKIFDKINALIKEIMRDPFRGTGKPEPLKGDLSGHWSRRITSEHRLIYKVFPDRIVITSCKYHYE
jgi:toxin YoeB